MSHTATAVVLVLLSASTYVSGRECRGSLSNSTEMSGWFASPKTTTTDHSDSNENCTWTIGVEEGHAIRVEINLIGTEKGYDVIEIFETTPSGVRRKTESFSGDKRALVYTSRTNRVEIMFVTNSSVVGEGFMASWKKIEKNECGGVFTGEKGSITFSDTDKKYGHCTWYFEVPAGSFNKFTFNPPFQMDMENNFYLFQVNASGKPLTLAEKYFQGDRVPPAYTSMSNRMALTYERRSAGGRFNLTWEKVGTRCGSILNDKKGVIKAGPSDPLFNDYTNCQWLLEAPKGSLIRLVFDPPFSDDPFNHSVLSVSPSGKEVDRNGEGPLSTYLSKTNRVELLHYNPDGIGTGKGFNVMWKAIDLISLCGGELNGTSGVIMSPNYPFYYPNYLDCTWTIQVSEGKFIRLTFGTPFEMRSESKLDRIEISEISRSGDSREKTRYHNNTVPPVSTSTTNWVKIRFKSYQNHDKNAGFHLTWQEVDTTDCGQVLEVVQKIPVLLSRTLHMDSECLPRHTRQRRCSLTFRAQPGPQGETYPLCTMHPFHIGCRTNSTARITVSNSTESVEMTCGESLEYKFCASNNEDLHVTYEGNGLCPSDMIDKIIRFLDVYQEKYKWNPRHPVDPVDDYDSSFPDHMYGMFAIGGIAVISGIVYLVIAWKGRKDDDDVEEGGGIAS